jgi:hypothetical protein
MITKYLKKSRKSVYKVMMFSFILTLCSALAISIVGAYFSIIGLSTIFVGSNLSVVIMGSFLEIGKVVTVLWLHKNWKKSGIMLKTYFIFAIVVLMGITSLGIFGFLSKSHLEHQAKANTDIMLIETADKKIEKENAFILQYEKQIKNLESSMESGSKVSTVELDREESRLKSLREEFNENISLDLKRIEQSKDRLKVLDNELNTLKDSAGGLFSNKKKKIEELINSQKEEREKVRSNIAMYNSYIESFREDFEEKSNSINKNIDSLRGLNSSQKGETFKNIQSLNDRIKQSMESIEEAQIEKAQRGKNIREMEAEIGPLKYVAEAVKDFGGNEISTDTAVRMLIMIIMVVFDPLALLLVVAAQITFFSTRTKEKKVVTKTKSESLPQAPQEKKTIKDEIKKVFLPTPQKDFKVLMDDD